MCLVTYQAYVGRCSDQGDETARRNGESVGKEYDLFAMYWHKKDSKCRRQDPNKEYDKLIQEMSG